MLQELSKLDSRELTIQKVNEIAKELDVSVIELDMLIKITNNIKLNRQSYSSNGLYFSDYLLSTDISKYDDFFRVSLLESHYNKLKEITSKYYTENDILLFTRQIINEVNRKVLNIEIDEEIRRDYENLICIDYRMSISVILIVISKLSLEYSKENLKENSIEHSIEDFYRLYKIDKDSFEKTILEICNNIDVQNMLKNTSDTETKITLISEFILSNNFNTSSILSLSSDEFAIMISYIIVLYESLKQSNISIYDVHIEYSIEIFNNIFIDNAKKIYYKKIDKADVEKISQSHNIIESVSKLEMITKNKYKELTTELKPIKCLENDIVLTNVYNIINDYKNALINKFESCINNVFKNDIYEQINELVRNMYKKSRLSNNVIISNDYIIEYIVDYIDSNENVKRLLNDIQEINDIDTLYNNYTNYCFDERLYTSLTEFKDTLINKLNETDKYTLNRLIISTFNKLSIYNILLNYIAVKYFENESLIENAKRIKLFNAIIDKFSDISYQSLNNNSGICLILSNRYLKNILERHKFQRLLSEHTKINVNNFKELYEKYAKIKNNQELYEEYRKYVSEIFNCSDISVVLKNSIKNDSSVSLEKPLEKPLEEQHKEQHKEEHKEELENDSSAALEKLSILLKNKLSITNNEYRYKNDNNENVKDILNRILYDRISTSIVYENNKSVSKKFALYSIIDNNNIYLKEYGYTYLNSDIYLDACNRLYEVDYGANTFAKVSINLLNKFRDIYTKYFYNDSNIESYKFKFINIRFFGKFFFNVYQFNYICYYISINQDSLKNNEIREIIMKIICYYMKTHNGLYKSSLFMFDDNIVDMINHVSKIYKVKENIKTSIINEIFNAKYKIIYEIINKNDKEIKNDLRYEKQFKEFSHITYKKYITYNEITKTINIDENIFKVIKEHQIFDSYEINNDKYSKLYNIVHVERVISVMIHYIFSYVFEINLKDYLKENKNELFPVVIDTMSISKLEKRLSHAICVSYEYDEKLIGRILDPNIMISYILEYYVTIFISPRTKNDISNAQNIDNLLHSIKHMSAGSFNRNSLEKILVIIIISIITLFIICIIVCVLCCNARYAIKNNIVN